MKKKPPLKQNVLGLRLKLLRSDAKILRYRLKLNALRLQLLRPIEFVIKMKKPNNYWL